MPAKSKQTRLGTREGGRGEVHDATRLPVTTVAGEFFRHTAPRQLALDIPLRATATGRYHRKRQEPRLYASSTRDAAWAELFRHTEPEISPFEVRRRMSVLSVRDLPVLDLTDASTREQLGVTSRNLTSNRHSDCRRLADLARQAPARFGGILAPSAVDPNAHTLVVFREWIPTHVKVLRHRVTRPPQRLFGVLERVIETLPPAAQDMAKMMLEDLRRQLRRARRSR